MNAAILLLDDNEDILEFLTDELQEKYTIYTAASGKQALTLLLKEPVQLIVSDVMMPEMDGFEFCRIIKTSLDYSHIPIILLTARDTLQSKIEGLGLGADAYMEKPFSPQHLEVQIANLLQSRSRLKEYFSKLPLTEIGSIAQSRPDETFLGQLNRHIRENMENAQLDVDQLAGLMHMSRPTLYRKIKGITDLTPHELINITRLKKAAELLSGDNYKIYEIAQRVGFQSQTSLGRNFLRQFGMTPTEYAASSRPGPKTGG